MASTSTLMASSTTSKILSKRNTNLPNPIPKPTLLPQIPKSLTKKSVSITAVVAMAAASPLPALAAEIEKAALFDFNLTLPAIAIEFLLLMVALDKIYFTPLGKFMDERDAAIRAKLGDVKDTSTEVKQLEEQKEETVKALDSQIAALSNEIVKKVLPAA